MNGSNRTPLLHKYYNGSDDPFVYNYDDNGNITSITQGSTSITYKYDVANRLTRENNSILNQTITYEYDVWGNITEKKIYAYTTATNPGTPTDTIGYTYNSTGWTDQLKKYGNDTISYDSMGNPTTYRGYTMTWRGKQLTSASNDTDTLSFEYNEDGLRQRKTVNDIDTDYFYNGSVLIGMQRGQSKFLFSYDATGNVVSVKYITANDENEYYYLRNAQGDVVKLIDASGVSVVDYTYDTWGKAVTTTGTLAGTLGLFQPFRYRGYVYDWETGFYYLQSRYYDPTTGRFISADVLLSTGKGVLGHNAYAYCLDNPVNLYDQRGSDSEPTQQQMDRWHDLERRMKLKRLKEAGKQAINCMDLVYRLLGKSAKLPGMISGNGKDRIINSMKNGVKLCETNQGTYCREFEAAFYEDLDYLNYSYRRLSPESSYSIGSSEVLVVIAGQVLNNTMQQGYSFHVIISPDGTHWYEGYKGIGGISEISDASTFISNSSDKTFLIGIYAVDLNYNGGSH